jgi:hypothetical protein
MGFTLLVHPGDSVPDARVIGHHIVLVIDPRISVGRPTAVQGFDRIPPGRGLVARDVRDIVEAIRHAQSARDWAHASRLLAANELGRGIDDLRRGATQLPPQQVGKEMVVPHRLHSRLRRAARRRPVDADRSGRVGRGRCPMS